MILTDLEIAVFGPRPNLETIEAFRYRCMHTQKLLAQLYPKRRRRKPHASVPGGLLTAAQAAAKLNCSIRTLTAHVASGDLKYVIIGRGSKRPRRYFTPADLDQFIANQTRKAQPCPSTATRTRHTGSSTSGGEVLAFTALQKRRHDGKPKK